MENIWKARLEEKSVFGKLGQVEQISDKEITTKGGTETSESKGMGPPEVV